MAKEDRVIREDEIGKGQRYTKVIVTSQEGADQRYFVDRNDPGQPLEEIGYNFTHRSHRVEPVSNPRIAAWLSSIPINQLL